MSMTHRLKEKFPDGNEPTAMFVRPLCGDLLLRSSEPIVDSMSPLRKTFPH